MTPLWFVVQSFAAYRLAVLITSDTITRPWRLKLAKRYPPSIGYSVEAGVEVEEAHPIVAFVNCGRCVSVWTAALVVGASWSASLLDGWQWALFGWPAVAGAVVLLVRIAP